MYVLDRKKMLELQAEEKRLGYESDSTKENDRLLELSEEEFAKLELKKSIEFNDPVRKGESRDLWRCDRSSRIVRSLFDRAPILYDPSDWASKSWNIFSRSSIADGGWYIPQLHSRTSDKSRGHKDCQALSQGDHLVL